MRKIKKLTIYAIACKHTDSMEVEHVGTSRHCSAAGEQQKSDRSKRRAAKKNGNRGTKPESLADEFRSFIQHKFEA